MKRLHVGLFNCQLRYVDIESTQAAQCVVEQRNGKMMTVMITEMAREMQYQCPCGDKCDQEECIAVPGSDGNWLRPFDRPLLRAVTFVKV